MVDNKEILFTIINSLKNTFEDHAWVACVLYNAGATDNEMRFRGGLTDDEIERGKEFAKTI